MAAFDYTDFYIIDKFYNKFNDTEIIEDDLIRIIIQKYQMLIFTSRGDVLGDRNLGTNVIELLYETQLSSKSIQERIQNQILTYIPEISGTPFELTVVFEQDPENYQDVMFINFKISEFEIVNQIGGYL